MLPNFIHPHQLAKLHKAHQTFKTWPLHLDSPLLSALAASERHLLDEVLDERHCQPGEIIIREGAAGEAMYIIRSGSVAVIKGDPESAAILGFRGPGEVIGEMALIDDRPNSASVVALTDQPRSASAVALEGVHLIRISRAGFQRLLTSDPGTGMGILKTLSSRLREADNDRKADAMIEQQLVKQVYTLKTEKEQLIEIQRLREETSNLILHDVRSPVTAIAGFVDLLRIVLPEAVLAENREIFEVTRASCDHLLHLVNSLLEVTRIESGEFPVSITSVPVLLVIEQVTSRFALLKQTNITTQVEVHPDLPLVLADIELLNRIFNNLVENALKHMATGGHLTLGARVENNEIWFSVADTGPGIPADQRERIFQRFAQVDNDPQRRWGFGLGLVLCRLAVEAQRGRIWVEDGPNQTGCRFVFTLPIAATA